VKEMDVKKIGIITCDRYASCAAGKCLRALTDRDGAFRRYEREELELVGITSCGGCPGGNIEQAPAEMKDNGAEIVHLATGFIVGYPPCPWLESFCEFIPVRFGLEVVIGTHPIPEKYYRNHVALGTWTPEEERTTLRPLLGDPRERSAYD
jgi:predicted metal-binding protein